MGFLKKIAVVAAAVAAYNYITKKRPDGTSVADDIKEKAPEWIDKAKQYGGQLKDQYNQSQNTGTPGTGPKL